jgi:predicted N-acetyltransferase YhbS
MVSRFDVDNVALSRVHGAAFGHDRTDPWRERLERHSLTWVGAFDGDALVGFVNVTWDGGEHAFLLDTAVLPDRQGQGIGGLVVTCAVEEARATGCSWLHVDHVPELTAFYARAGFRPTAAGLLPL